MEGAAWTDLYRWRREAHERYPRLSRLPVIPRASRLVRPYLRDGIRILDIGSGGRGRAERLAAGRPGAATVSVDPDPAARADHASIGEVAGTFDVALCLEVVEHLPLAEVHDLLGSIRDRLAPDGVLVLSTPNVFCPGRYLRDATHVTPFAWDELGGAVLRAGLDLRGLYRVRPGTLLSRWGRVLLAPLARGLGIDTAPGIAAVATKPVKTIKP